MFGDEWIEGSCHLFTKTGFCSRLFAKKIYIRGVFGSKCALGRGSHIVGVTKNFFCAFVDMFTLHRNRHVPSLLPLDEGHGQGQNEGHPGDPLQPAFTSTLDPLMPLA